MRLNSLKFMSLLLVLAALAVAGAGCGSTEKVSTENTSSKSAVEEKGDAMKSDDKMSKDDGDAMKSESGDAMKSESSGDAMSEGDAMKDEK